MAPVIEKLAQEFEDQIDLIKVDADKPENEELLNKHDVRSIPTLIMVGEGTVVEWELGRKIGQQSEAELRSWIQEILADCDTATFRFKGKINDDWQIVE